MSFSDSSCTHGGGISVDVGASVACCNPPAPPRGVPFWELPFGHSRGGPAIAAAAVVGDVGLGVGGWLTSVFGLGLMESNTTRFFTVCGFAMRSASCVSICVVRSSGCSMNGSGANTHESSNARRAGVGRGVMPVPVLAGRPGMRDCSSARSGLLWSPLKLSVGGGGSTTRLGAAADPLPARVSPSEPPPWLRRRRAGSPAPAPPSSLVPEPSAKPGGLGGSSASDACAVLSARTGTGGGGGSALVGAWRLDDSSPPGRSRSPTVASALGALGGSSGADLPPLPGSRPVPTPSERLRRSTTGVRGSGRARHPVAPSLPSLLLVKSPEDAGVLGARGGRQGRVRRLVRLGVQRLGASRGVNSHPA